MDKVTPEFNHGVDDFNAAELLRKEGMLLAACNRYYYAVFHCLQACLQTQELQFKSHSQVQGVFNKLFIHSGILPQEASKWISVTSSMRDKSDYDIYYEESEAETLHSAECAKNLIKSVSKYLFDNGYYALKTLF